MTNKEVWVVKDIPEVLALDGAINNFVHRHDNQRSNEIQQLFWKAIEAIQQKVHAENPLPEPVEGAEEVFSVDHVWKLYSEDKNYGTKSYSQFAKNNGWAMIKKQAMEGDRAIAAKDRYIKELDELLQSRASEIRHLQSSLNKYMNQPKENDRIDKVIEWCEQKLKYYESTDLTDYGEGGYKTMQDIKIYLQQLKQQ